MSELARRLFPAIVAASLVLCVLYVYEVSLLWIIVYLILAAAAIERLCRRILAILKVIHSYEYLRGIILELLSRTTISGSMSEKRLYKILHEKEIDSNDIRQALMQLVKERRIRRLSLRLRIAGGNPDVRPTWYVLIGEVATHAPQSYRASDRTRTPA